MTEPLSGDELEAFYDLANRFIAVANEALREWEAPTVSAAFLYGCARYNSFLLQKEGHPPGKLDEESLVYFRDCYTHELREHMTETLMKGHHSKTEQGDFTLQDLGEFEGWVDEDRQGFFDLGDAFIAVANQLIGGAKASRISAAFMHACARYNVYVMQTGGLTPGEVDDERVETYAGAYADLLKRHMQDHLIPPGG